ncbi:MAG: hypothetical protein V5A46_03380 [Haloferacaceae archaeon]
MAEEHSLDEFLPGGDDGEDGGAAGGNVDDEGDAGDVTHREASIPPSEADPASATSRYVTGGESCAACGTVVPRLWIREGEPVCPDCKEW